MAGLSGEDAEYVERQLHAFKKGWRGRHERDLNGMEMRPMAEALSVGIPIVAADTNINREICGGAAIYFSPFKAGELCEQVRRLDGSPDLRKSLKKAAVERARHFHDWDGHVARLIETFEIAMNSKG